MRILSPALVLLLALTVPGAPAARAGPGPPALEPFFGLWTGVVVAQQPASGGARDVDVAIWGSADGFAMSWPDLRPTGSTWLRMRFVATGSPQRFVADADSLALAGRGGISARIDRERLSIEVRGPREEPAEVARFECFIANGRLQVRYTRAQGERLLQTMVGTLRRIKVVM